MTLQHDRISPTAKLVAYWRQFSDIPFSHDVVELFDVENVYQTIFKSSNKQSLLDSGIIAPLLEIRYKSIENLLIKRNIKQVLEFASGISLRGLSMTKDSSLIYVETDLPDLNDEKIKLVHTIMDRHEIAPRNNLFFHSVNILNYDEIEPVLSHFDTQKQIAIVHEGLFQYLTHAEKALAAQNILRIFKSFHGCWLTPDLDTKAGLRSHSYSQSQFDEFIDTIKEATGRDFSINAFKDDQEIFSFFENLGFKVGFEPQMFQNTPLSSVKDKSLSKEVMQDLLALRLWILSKL